MRVALDARADLDARDRRDAPGRSEGQRQSRRRQRGRESLPGQATAPLALPDPIGGRDRTPSRTNRFILGRRQRPRAGMRNVLRDTLRPRRAYYRRRDADRAEREPERDPDRIFDPAPDKIVVELLQTI